MLEAMLLTFDKVPFTCVYIPSENMKALGPVYAAGFLILASLFARLEHGAIVRGRTTFAVVTLLIIYLVIRVTSHWRWRPPTVDFDEGPSHFNRLGLDS